MTIITRKKGYVFTKIQKNTSISKANQMVLYTSWDNMIYGKV